MTRKLQISSLLSLTLVSGVALADGSPWLPAHGSTTLSANITNGSTDRFFAGDTSIDLGADLSGTYLWLNAIFGYDDIWAFDFRTGYAETELDIPGPNIDSSLNSQEDFAETTFGVSYQLINEFEADNGLPTVTGRLAYTIGGNYDPNRISSIGDGASGVDLSLLVGKSLNSAFAVFGDITFRQRDGGVADGVKFLLSTFYTSPIRGLGFQLAYAGVRTDSDLDFGAPGVGVDQFSQTDRDSDFLIGGVNYGFGNGFGVGFSYTALINGRNIADTDVANFSTSYSF